MLIAGDEPDFILINEVIPKAQAHPIAPALLTLPGYNMYSNFDPMTENLGKSGIRGICIYVKKTHRVAEFVFKDSSYKEQLWVQMTLPGSDKLLLGCTYRSPSGLEEESVQELGELFRLACNSSFSHVVITGDFNLPQIDWKLGLTCAPPTHCSHAFMELVNDCFLYQHVTQPTRFRPGSTPHVLDLVFSNEEGMIKNLEFLPGLCSSDHVVLQFQLVCCTPATEPAEHRPNFNKGNYRLLNERLGAVNWGFEQSHAPEAIYSCIKGTLSSLSRACIPLTKPRVSNRSLYINREAMKLKKRKRSLWVQYMRSGNIIDHVRFTRARNRLRTLTRKLRADFERKLARDLRNNPKGFWRYAGSRLRTRTTVEDLQAEDGTVARDDNTKANLLNQYFHSVFTTEDPHLPSPPPTYQGTVLEDVNVSPAAVREKLEKLKPGSAPGPDGLHPRVLRETAATMAEPWSQLFRSCLDSGRLPLEWQKDEIVPIFKKGSKQTPANYRPVTLTAVPCKVLESLIRDQLFDHLESSEQLSDAQHGFRRKRSCTTQLLDTLDEWTDLLERGDPVDAIYLDFSKAFNSVPHQRLLLKLRSCGVGGKLLTWIEAFLTGRQQRVTVNGTKSDWAPVTSGVPQGTVLGPLLFVIYVNDMPGEVRSSLKMFADDTKLYRSVGRESDNGVLQEDLDSLVEWSERWQLPFNREKCKTLHLGGRNDCYTYHMGDVQLSQTPVEKDLGVFVDRHLKFREQAASAITKASRIMAVIRRSFSVIDKTTLPLLFRTMVRPHLEYANSVWGPFNREDQKKVERVQRRATRLVSGIRDLPYEERLRTLDLPSLYHRRRRGDMITVYQVLHQGVDVNAAKFFTPAAASITRGHQWKLAKPRAVSRVRRNVLSVRVINEWNALPPSVIAAPSVNAFKARLDKHWADSKFTTHIND